MRKEKVKKLLIFLRVLVLLLIPIIPTYLVISYFTPEPITIPYDIICESKDGEQQCNRQIREGIDQAIKNTEEKVNNIERLAESLRFGSDIIRFNPQVINNSNWILEITDPKQRMVDGADVICKFDRDFILKRYTLRDVPGVINKLQNKLTECMPNFQSVNFSEEFVWGSGAWLSIKLEEEYSLKFNPDKASYVYTYIILMMYILVMISVSKEVYKFILKGVNND